MLERPHAKPALEAEDDHAHLPGADMVQAA
jgi:hypothetical protein